MSLIRPQRSNGRQMRPEISDPGRDFSLIKIVTPDGDLCESCCQIVKFVHIGLPQLRAQPESAPALASVGRGRAGANLNISPREISTLRPGPASRRGEGVATLGSVMIGISSSADVKRNAASTMNHNTVLVTLLTLTVSSVQGMRTHFVYWNSSNPAFNRLDNTEQIIDINENNLAWEYDQLHLVCPQNTDERHVVYSVSREEYDSCRVTNPKPKIVAICNKPESFMYFTITFRSFSPTPGGLEFKPGQDYYFISTSTRRDIHRRVGGYCQSHKMKMVFRVHDNTEKRIEETVPSYSGLNEVRSQPQTRAWAGLRPGSDYIYYYKPWASESRHQLRSQRLRPRQLSPLSGSGHRRVGSKILKALPLTAASSASPVSLSVITSAALALVTVARGVSLV